MENQKKVAAMTLGCKVNLYDTEAMLGLFVKEGYEVVDFNQVSDIYIVNTCTVTNLGDKKSRQMLRRAKKQNPQAIIVAAGCYAQVAPEEIGAIEEVQIIIGTKDRHRIVELVKSYENSRNTATYVDNIMAEREFENLEVNAMSERTRAYVKIQEGCDRFCSYCIIPYARGPVRSRDEKSVLKEVKHLSHNGYKEIVLTGIHVASYGKDLKSTNLLKLMHLVHEVEGIERIRFSSIEPTVVSNEFINSILAMPKICDHFHLSLQSGCNKTLVNMKRQYLTSDYEEAVLRLREVKPDAAITTDVICGFPGESQQDHEESYEFIEKLNLSKLHVFPYSAKKGTKAAGYAGQIDKKKKEQRSKELTALSHRLEQQFLEKFVDRKLGVLYEQEVSPGIFEGHSTNYIKVRTKSGKCIENEIFQAKVLKIEDFTAITDEI